MIKPVFLTTLFEKRKTIEALTEESRVDAQYYLFLFFSSFITTLGLAFGNAVIIIAGMLITPLMFPVLALGMGVATVSRDAIKRSVFIIFKSVVLVVLLSAAVAFLTGQEALTEELELASRPDIWFFLVAFFSGIVAAYSWVKQNASVTLPSVALAVSLIVPLSAIGVSFSLAAPSKEVFSGAVMLFVTNLLAIVLASVLVFLLFGFTSLQHWQEQKIREEELERNDRQARETP